MSRTWAAALAPTNSLTDTLVYFALLGGLRIVDVADPLSPREIGYFSPSHSPAARASRSNHVDIDLIYLADRNILFDILKLRG